MKRKNIIGILYLFVVISSFAMSFSSKEEIFQKSAKLTRENYPNAHEILLEDITYYNYDESGRYESVGESYIKIMDDLGLKENSVIEFHYDKSYSSMEIIEFDIIKSNGDIKNINYTENIKEQIDPSGIGSNIYNENDKMITVQVAGIEVGDLVHFRVKEKHHKARIDGEFSNFAIGEYTYPIIHLKSVIEGPKTNELKKRIVLDGIEGRYREDLDYVGDKFIYTFEVDNVAKIVTEESMPPISEVAMRNLVTTMESWNDISKWYYELSEGKMIKTNAIEEKVKELIKDKKTDQEKIENIFFFVSRNIRYMGLTTETNRPGLEPHATDYTFDTMTGVCRDKAALIVLMLRIAGYDANMILINVSRKLDKEVPLSYFNHAIAGIRMENGEDILMDPTDETSNVMLPEYEANKSYIMARKDGDDLRITKINSPKINLLKIENKVKIEGEKIRVKTKIKFNGLNDNAYRSYFLRLNSEDRKKFIAKKVKQLSQNSNLIDFEIKPVDLLNDKAMMELNFEYVLNEYLIKNDLYALLKEIGLGEYFGVQNWILSDIGLNEREYDLYYDFNASLEEKTEIELSDNLNVLKLPDDFQIKNDYYDYKKNYTVNKNIINIDKEISYFKLNYPTKIYQEIKKDFSNIENAERKYIILSQKEVK